MEPFSAILVLCLILTELFVQGDVVLKVDETLYGQLLYHGTSARYVLHRVSPGTKYEVRVSYPAIIPTDFVIKVSRSRDLEGHASRKLLNVEQLQFLADDETYFIDIRAYRTGVPIDEKLLEDPVPFNIIVNRLFYGCSYETWKILAFGLLLIFVVLKFIHPAFRAYVMDIWLDESVQCFERKQF